MIFGKSLKKYYKKYGFLMIIGTLCLIAVDYVQLRIPELLGNVVNIILDTTRENVLHDVLMISLEVVFIALGMFVGRVLFRITLFRSSTGIGKGLRQEMFEKSERLDVEYYHNQKVGNIMSLITSDTEEIQEFFGWGIVMLTDGIFMTIICVIKMIRLDWAISILIFIPIIAIVILSFVIEKVMTKIWLIRQKALDEVYDFTQETFLGIRVIKAFVKEVQQLKHFCKVAKKSEKADFDISLNSSRYDVLLEIIIGLVNALIICVGGYLVYRTINSNPFSLFGKTVELHADSLVVFLSYFATSIWPLIALGQVITMRSRAKASLDRIEAFLDTPEVIVDAKDAIDIKDVKGKIEFRNLSFAYPSQKEDYIKGISLTINSGETVGIVGRIGSGKSTLVSLLSRLYQIKENSIFIDDVDIMKIKVKSLRDNIAVVPQENFLFSTSIKNNIKFGKKDATNKEITEASKFSDIEKDILGFEKKYETLTGERGVSLSGGQKQRIAISRAFIKDAPIMIFDDSVSAVDIKTEEAIIDNIKKLRKGKTTIVVASRISTVNSLDKIIVLNNGSLEAFGTPEELLSESATFKKMVYLQRIENELKEGK